MIAFVVAISKNNCIGKNGKLPWDLPGDMKHFVKLTTGRVVLMGRKTWESIPDKFRPLPNRTNIVITRNTEYSVPEGVEVYNNIEKALDAHKNEDIMIIGGAQIYNQTMDVVDTLYITHVDQFVDCDAFFPKINKNEWKETEREDLDEYSFVTYKKI